MAHLVPAHVQRCAGAAPVHAPAVLNVAHAAGFGPGGGGGGFMSLAVKSQVPSFIVSLYRITSYLSGKTAIKNSKGRERERERERESVCTNSREPTSTHFGVVWPFGTGMMTANASMLQTNIGGPFSETLAAANLRGGPFKQRQIACVITGCD